MDTTTILPTQPTAGAIVQGSRDCRNHDVRNYDNQLGDWIGIEATNRNGQAVLKSVGDAAVADMNATNLNGVAIMKNVSDASVAGINSTNLNGVSIIKNITDAAVAGINATNLNGVSVTKAVTDASMANLNAISTTQATLALSGAEQRIESLQHANSLSNLINTTSTASALAQKDILISVAHEGCKTREKSQDQFAALQLEMAKNRAHLELQAANNKADLAKQIADCCCETKLMNKDLEALILKQTQDRTKDELMESRFKILALENKIPTVCVAA